MRRKSTAQASRAWPTRKRLLEIAGRFCVHGLTGLIHDDMMVEQESGFRIKPTAYLSEYHPEIPVSTGKSQNGSEINDVLKFFRGKNHDAPILKPDHLCLREDAELIARFR